MKLAFTIKGQVYHRHKDMFKKKMREFGLRWVGTFDSPKWASDIESITARFIRNEANTFTIEAVLIWEGKEKTDFHQYFKDFCEHFKGILIDSESDMKTFTDTDLLFFDRVFKPNVKEMKRRNCPQKFIDMAIDDYKEKRKEEFGDIDAEN